MSHYWEFIFLALLIGSAQFSEIAGRPSNFNNFKQKPNPPALQVFKGLSRTTKALLAISNTNGDKVLIVNSTEINALTLRCDADYPVRITYEGQASPFQQRATGKMNVVLPNNPGMELFHEEVYFMSLDPSLSHKYICHSVQFSEKRSTVDIYIPGGNLFSKDSGETFQLGNGIEKFVVSCGVTHPETSVTLSKFNKDGNIAEIIQADFEPMHGFIVDVNPFEDPSGKYVCTAKLGNNTRVVLHTLYQDQEFHNKKCTLACPEDSHCVSTPPGFEHCKCDDSYEFVSFKAFSVLQPVCQRKCVNDLDCPKNKTCRPFDSRFLNLESVMLEEKDKQPICMNPCIHAKLNGECDDTCLVEDRVAKCSNQADVNLIAAVDDVLTNVYSLVSNLD